MDYLSKEFSGVINPTNPTICAIPSITVSYAVAYMIIIL